MRGTIEKVEGNTLAVKARDGAVLTVALTGNVQVVGVVKASLAEIKEGSYVGSAAMPQADGSQKALEVHIFAESQRGTGDGHRGNWDGSPYGAGVGTMTNGAAGQAVSLWSRLSPRKRGERGGHHYIGTTPLRPTLMRAALKVPSGFLVAAATLMAAPGLSSPLSPTS